MGEMQALVVVLGMMTGTPIISPESQWAPLRHAELGLPAEEPSVLKGNLGTSIPREEVIDGAFVAIRLMQWGHTR